jgi:hypothetical protein
MVGRQCTLEGWTCHCWALRKERRSWPAGPDGIHISVSSQSQIEVRKLFLISKYFYKELINLTFAWFLLAK